MTLLNLIYFDMFSIILSVAAILLNLKPKMMISISLGLILLTFMILIFSKNQRQSMFQTLELRKYFRKDKSNFENDDAFQRHKQFLSLMSLNFKGNELIFKVDISKHEEQLEFEKIKSDVLKYIQTKYQNYAFSTFENGEMKGVKR